MNISFSFKWFDFWVGFYYDVGHKTLYICPLPTIVCRIQFSGAQNESLHRTDRHEEFNNLGKKYSRLIKQTLDNWGIK